ncbi:MAG: bifunctional dTDP-4-dehydrorhamnose 3,5-epimerase family protein/NAD(P)-dependent oxidoreductase, partial [Propionibacteriaceae bacterium]|nr:bifunctional dTDP-4-dehydrorhamnose 3,5-epimerase family protein/NAD(P)-dependent oxidoreductase [Propionibacteriaceae bacterium]
EPWDKLVSAAKGRYFGAWVDLREGPGYGTVFTTVVDESVAVFVPRGVGNSYQTLEDDVAYSYLVNDHWSAEAVGGYSFVNLADPTVGIQWPIPLSEVEISDKDKDAPLLADAKRVPMPKTLILGGNGQLGRALGEVFPDADRVDIDVLDLTDPSQVEAWPWRDYDVVINAAAWTAVDAAETPEGRRGAWKANAEVPSVLARLAIKHRHTLVHVSSDYVFDGSKEAWTETEDLCPLGVYGQSKAAGDLAVCVAPKHYLLRTSWVVGDGKNFVKTMRELAAKGVKPQVIDDQVGRLTHTSNLAAAIKHLLESRAEYGTYNCTDGGAPVSWAEIAKAAYAAVGADPGDVTPVSTAAYNAGKEDVSPRPASSVLELSKLEATGYKVPVFELGV